MKTKILYSITWLLISSLLLSCEKEDNNEGPDTTKPQAEITSPVDDQVIVRGGSFIFSARFTDNRGLEKYEVSLRNLKSANGSEDPWTPDMEDFSLTGEVQSVTGKSLFQQIVPADIWVGNYTLFVKVYDEVGNSSVYTVGITIQ